MQALKAVVIFMSLLLVVGFGVLGYGIMNDWHKKDQPVEEEAVLESADAPAPVVSTPVVKLEAFGDWEVPLPAGAVIRDMEAKAGVLYLRYVSGGKGGVIVLDMKTKTHLGTIKFK